jgi:hypothetical protein
MASPPRKAPATSKKGPAQKGPSKKTDWLSPPVKTEKFTHENAWHFTMQVVVSLVVLVLGCYLLIYSDKDGAKYGAGLLGIIIGYWIK